MKSTRLRSLFLPALLTGCAFVSAHAQAQAPSSRSKSPSRANTSSVANPTSVAGTRLLRNGDVLRMHKTGMKPGEIIAKIVTSQCTFDIFPPVLQELKMKGLPDTVIMAMVMAPYGPPLAASHPPPPLEPPPATARVQIPAGTIIEIEAASPVSSARANEGDKMKFRVSRQVLVNGALVIERGAPATARVIKGKRAGSWGRGGSLGWVLEDVVAIDGTRVPIRLSDQLKGKNISAAVVLAAIATGAVILPYSGPVGLMWALKRGDEAVLDESRISSAIVGSSTEVSGLLPKEPRVIYHSVEKLNAADKEKGDGSFNTSFRPTPIGKH
jgi:hypothetical protein